MNMQNSEIMKKLFGPLDGQWCLYFYVLAVISFVFLVMSVGNLVMCLFSKKKIDENLLKKQAERQLQVSLLDVAEEGVQVSIILSFQTIINLQM